MKEHYALTNPLSVILEKTPEEFTREDLIHVIELQQIERITFHYTALDGKYKELKIPITGRRQAERILAEGDRVDGSSLFKGMVDPSLSDLYVVPVYRTAFLNPFEENSIDFTCRYLTREGELAPFALDSILHRAAELFRKNTGMELYAMGELEFFLLSATTSKLFLATRQHGYHSAAPFVKSGLILDEMVRQISQITGAVKYAHSEVGYLECVRSNHEEIQDKHAEQLEIEFLPRPVEEAADHLVLARWLIRNIAFKHGCVATFTPKLEEGMAGNGFHIHMEAMKNGANVMLDEGGNLSANARKIIGGLCTYADTLTAFGNTVSSAYLRLVPNQEAPTRICWSNLNRSAMIRVPLGWASMGDLSQRLNPQQQSAFIEEEGRQTIELRSPDGSALVHLLLAGITMAAEWGVTIAESLHIAEKSFVAGNVFQEKALLEKLSVLPKSCVESAQLLIQKRYYYERENIFPPSVIEYVAKMLASENDEDMNRRLVDLPADDRLHETRKIMHKDLHKH